MSLVTTPSRSWPASSPQTAAIRLLLPEPTGPPTPIRRARSAGKESLPLVVVDRRGELDGHGGGRRQRPAVGSDPPRGGAHRGREVGEPADRHRRIERQELQ